MRNAQMVAFAIVDSIFVSYTIDSSFTRIPNSQLGLENWNVKSLRKYFKNTDTITMEWFNNYGKFNDTIGISMLGRDLGRKIHGAHSPPLPLNDLQPKLLEFYDLNGVSSTVRLGDRTIFMCYGANKASDVLVCVTYSSGSNKRASENDFFCILESMRFQKTE